MDKFNVNISSTVGFWHYWTSDCEGQRCIFYIEFKMGGWTM